MRSLKAIAPTRSLLAAAEKPSSPATSTAKRRTLRPVVPKAPEGLKSITISSVRSRSSTNSLTYGAPRRAVTFQSIRRTSSPGV